MLQMNIAIRERNERMSVRRDSSFYVGKSPLQAKSWKSFNFGRRIKHGRADLRQRKISHLIIWEILSSVCLFSCCLSICILAWETLHHAS